MLKIKNWDQYENNRTRNMEDMRWVPVPNRFDGDQITEVIEEGAAIYGAWVAVLLVASRCKPRGELIRENGEPHDAKTLSRRTRLPQKDFDRAIPILISAGLIERCTNTAGSRQEGAGEVAVARQEGAGEVAVARQEGAGSAHPTDYGMEWKGIERIERKERKKEPVTVDSLTIPDSIKTPDALEALSDWLDYKRSRREGYKKAGHLNGLLKTYSDPETLARDIRHSIGSGYKGLITAPGSSNRQPVKKQIFKYIPTKQVNA